IQRLLHRRQLWLEIFDPCAEEFCSLSLPIRIGKGSHQYEHQLGVLGWSNAVDCFQVFQISAVCLCGGLFAAAKNASSPDGEQQNTQQHPDPRKSLGLHKGAHVPTAQEKARPHQDPNHNRKDEPRILYSNLRRRGSAEITRQQDGAKNRSSWIEISRQADKLNDAQVHDKAGWISEPDRSLDGNWQLQHLDDRVKEQESHDENGDQASSQQLSLGGAFEFVLRLHICCLQRDESPSII